MGMRVESINTTFLNSYQRSIVLGALAQTHIADSAYNPRTRKRLAQAAASPLRRLTREEAKSLFLRRKN